MNEFIEPIEHPLIPPESTPGETDYVDKTSLSYWFPKLEAAGLPVPKTILIKADDNEVEQIYKAGLNGEELGIDGQQLISRIKIAADSMGYPCFLRTDHTSAKHEWEETCYLPYAEAIESHVYAIINFWECIQMVAPWADVWVIRELLPTLPLGVCPRYGNFPICREFRFFVKDEEIICWHPYWPDGALRDGGAQYDKNWDYELLTHTTDREVLELAELASAAGKAVGGEWSVDILETKNGWMLTDMAEASKSWHWPGCQNVNE
jgi:hypothetical protein